MSRLSWVEYVFIALISVWLIAVLDYFNIV